MILNQDSQQTFVTILAVFLHTRSSYESSQVKCVIKPFLPQQSHTQRRVFLSAARQDKTTFKIDCRRHDDKE